jgi:hypothetical protein
MFKFLLNPLLGTRLCHHSESLHKPVSNMHSPKRLGFCGKRARRRPPSEQWISLSGADPLNLIGVLTPGPRLAALTDNRLVYRDGVPVAALSGGKVQFLTTLDAKNQWEAEKRLVRSAARGLLSHLS